MAGLQFSFTGNNKTLLKDIAHVQQALATMHNELEKNGESFEKFFNEAAKGGIDLTKVLTGNANETKKFAATIKSSLADMQKAWDGLTDEMKASPLGVVFQDTMIKAKDMSEEVANGLLKTGKAANHASGGYNGLAVQMQMLAREVPNLAQSFTIFMMAIGNNLPMLADELEKANAEVKRMKAAGEKVTPVWRQAVGALLNWQTLLIAGVTAMTLYGDEIGNFIKDIFNMNKALKSTAEMQEAINESLADSTGNYGKQVTELKKLQSGWAALGGDMSKQKKFIIENKDAFDDLGVKVTSVADAENLLITNTDAFIKALQSRAVAEAGYKLATEEYEKALRKRIEADAMPEMKNVSKVGINPETGTMESSSVTVKNTEKEKANETAEALFKQGDAYIELGQKKAAEAKITLDNANIQDAENKALEEERKRLQDLQNAHDDYLRKLQDFEQAKKDAITKGEKAATDAMKEGYQKQQAQMIAAHEAEMQQIEKEMADLLQKKVEAAKALAESKGQPFKAESVTLTAEETKVFTDRKADTATRQKAEVEAFNATIKQMTEAAKMANASLLEQQLFDIDTYYQEEIRKAEGFEELKTQLTKNWAAERAKAENEARLQANQQAENIALMDVDTKYQGTGLTERAEKEKTEIVIKYAEERIKILKALGDEQSQAEADNLQKQIEAYRKQLKQPMSVKGWFDSKIFDKLKKKYLELGQTEAEAEANAANFFGGVQEGANKTVEAVGLLQTAFGGLDEGLDKALGAVSSVASGFASGGMVGGIAAAAGVALGAISKLGAADYSQYNKLVEEYDSLIDVWDTLIEKKSEYVSINFGDEAQKAGDEAVEILKKQTAAYEELGIARLNAGAGWGSHSIGVRQRKGMSQSGWNELAQAAKEIGFNYNSVADGRMTGLFDLTAQQLSDLQEKAPTFWAMLDDEVRGYLQNIIDCQDEIDTMGERMDEAVTGVDFNGFYENFVSTLTDMNSDSEDFAEDFGNYLKNAIMRNIVANKYKGQIENLYNSWANLSDSDKDGAFDLTSSETAELQAAQKALADAMLAERDALANTFGWSTGASYSQEASKGAFTTMSQDTGNELNGRFTAFQASNEAISTNTKQIAEAVNIVLTYMPNITGSLSDLAALHSETNIHLGDIVGYNKKMLSTFTDYLQQIVANTKNL